MLLYLFPNLKDNALIKLINKFFYSKFYIIAIGLIVLLCHTFSFEIVYYYFAAIGLVGIPALFCEDMISVVPPLAMTYSSVSLKSNNTRFDTTIVGGANKIHLIVIVAIIFVFVLTRLVFNLIKDKESRIKPALLTGYVVLGACYLLGGFLSPYYKKDTVLYGLVAFLSVSGCYFLLLYLIKWKKVPKDYYAWVMTVYGLVVAFEVFFIVIKIKTGYEEYMSWHDQIFTGWGMRNNIAGQIVLCVAAPVYLAIKNKKFSAIFLILPFIMLFGALLTNSRGGSLFSALIIAGALVIFFLKTQKNQKYQCLGVLGGVLLVSLVVFLIKRQEITELLVRFFDKKPDISDVNDFSQNRDIVWHHGFMHFIERPLFGVGFYQCADYRFINFSTSFVPARYHSIYIQFLASTGIFGLAAYFYHRYQTLRITFKQPSLEKTFIYLSVAGLIICSIIDNNFFNLGPGLNYCIALAFIEGLNIQDAK